MLAKLVTIDQILRMLHQIDLTCPAHKLFRHAVVTQAVLLAAAVIIELI